MLNERLRLANYRLRQLDDEKKWREIGMRRSLYLEDFDRLVKMGDENAERV